jgi:dihydropyrimidinase
MVARKADPSLDFAQVPGGMSNVQTSVGMLYAEGVAQGRLSLGQFVATTSTNPAKLFGMWPRKGTIAIGADADLVVIDPSRKVQLETRDMQSNSDFEPFDGRTFTGWPVLTMSRGSIVVQENQLVGERSHGRLVARTDWGL